MSDKALTPVHLLKAVSMASTITSPAVHVQYQDNVGIELVWSGTPTGTFAVQASVDHAEDLTGNITNAGHWVTLTLSASVTAAGTADFAYVDLNQLSAPWYRVVYTAVSGAGSLDLYVTQKAV